MKNKFVIRELNNKKYAICYTSKYEKFIIDEEDLENVKDIDKTFYINKGGYIIYAGVGRGATKYYLHRLILNYTGDQYIDHINGVKTDNRKCNLRIVSQSIQNKNQAKRKRKDNLPENSGINPQEIPQFIHYDKQGYFEISVKLGNGERFRKRTCSGLPLTEQLNEATCVLKDFQKENPEYFKDHYRINGEQNELAERLFEEYKNLAEP